jgi:DNA repair protein RadC
MTIKSWPEQERPREKLLTNGSENLSNAELLAIFLRTGVKGKNAIELACELLTEFGSLRSIFEASPQEFCRHHGLGPAKYVQLQAVLELSRRYLFENIEEIDVLTNLPAAKQYLLAKLGHYKHEIFGCLFLDSKHKVLAFKKLFHGSIDRSEVYPREVIKAALAYHATAVILTHNHPSGDPNPSDMDILVTKHLRKALALVDISVLDHIVIGRRQAISLVEEGAI